MYRLRSEETSGTTKNRDDISLIYAKRVGYSAAFLVAAFLLLSLKARTASILLRTSGIEFISLGVAFTSHRHHLVLLCI